MPKCFASARVAAAGSNCHAGSVRVGSDRDCATHGAESGTRSSAASRRSTRAAASATGTSVKRELARGEIEPRDAGAMLARVDGDEQAVALGVEQVRIGHRARRDDAQHLALDGSLAGRRVADLLADRDRLAQLHQLARGSRSTAWNGTPAIGIGAPAEAPRAVSVMSRSLRRALGVVVEQLVEIAHAVEQELVRMLRLDAKVLLHHRRVRRQRKGGTGGRRGHRRRL